MFARSIHSYGKRLIRALQYPITLTCTGYCLQWDLDTLRCDKTIDNAHELNITAVTQSPFDKSAIASGSRDYSVKRWDIECGACTAAYSTPRNIVTALEPSPVQAATLYQGSEDLFVRVWDLRVASGTGPVQVISGFVYFPVCMAVHPEGNLLATGCKGFDGVGCTVKLWDLRNAAQPVAEYAGHSQDVVGCAFSARDSDLLLSTSKDGSVRVWDTTSGSAEMSKPSAVASIPHTGKLNSCLAVPPGAIEDLGVTKGVQRSREEEHGTNPLDGNIVAVGAMDGSISLAQLSRHVAGEDRGSTLSVFCTTAHTPGEEVGAEDT
jgi:WD40 repeat protein